MKPIETKILAMFDRGQDVPAIAEAVSRSLGYVYSVLREHRPKRKRKAHKTRRDSLRHRILDCINKGMNASQIPAELGVSRQLVRRYWPLRKDEPEMIRMIVGLYQQGIKPARISAVLGCSRDCVYRNVRNLC